MKFILEVDLEAGALADEPGPELGRILRYWGGAAKDLGLTEGLEHDIFDSGYTKVGTLRVVG